MDSTTLWNPRSDGEGSDPHIHSFVDMQEAKGKMEELEDKIAGSSHYLTCTKKDICGAISPRIWFPNVPIMSKLKNFFYIANTLLAVKV